MIENPAYDSDREACFKWFARVSPCVCVCAHVYVYVCVYTLAHVCESVCVYMRACVCAACKCVPSPTSFINVGRLKPVLSMSHIMGEVQVRLDFRSPSVSSMRHGMVSQ